MTRTDFFRAAVLATLLAAGSCTAPSNDATGPAADGAVNHPIAVEPSYRELKMDFVPGGMNAADTARFNDFMADYSSRGTGSVAISVPNGAPARNAIGYFAEAVAAAGVPRDKIIVSTHDAPPSDFRVSITFISYQARVAPCGDWSENLAFTADNHTSQNFGCSVQHNIAAMVADPRDLLGPRPMDDVDLARRAAVLGHYEAGEATQAVKHTNDSGTEQSAPGSGVGQQ